ncbi:Carboxylesterase family-domain-containing protein [Aspergillus recurvatus]
MAGVGDIAFVQPLLSSLLTKADTEHFPQMWLKRGVAAGECVAYSLPDNSTLSVECGRPLRALCTNTAEYQLGVESPSASRLVVVDTPQGRVKGFRDRLTARFQGIPYAQPPVGDRRLRNPERLNVLPAGKGTSVFDGTAFGPLCPQDMLPNATPDLPNPDYTISEDCLYLNVYTPLVPNKDASTLLPVLFWIHGGSNYYGGSSLPFYLGMNVASRGRMVVVSINYRLGALGFLSDPSGSPEIGSNQAMRDQLLALEWVHKHIGSYGGDHQRVTIFGESSGGSAVMSLLQTPTAEKLFARAIVQSGSTFSGWQRPPVQESLTQLFLSIAGCEDLHCVKHNRTTSQVLEYQGRLFLRAQGLFPRGQVNFVEPFRPVIDGELLTEDWDTALDGSRYHKVPTLVTYTRDEFGLCLQANETFKDPPTNYTAAVEFLATFLLGEQRTNTVLNSPILGFDRSLIKAHDVTDPLIQFTTDITYRCSSEIYAGYLEQHNRDVWEMSWDIGLPQFLAGSICGNGTQRACHAAELPILFASANYANISSDVLASVNYFEQARSTIDLYSSFMHGGTLIRPSSDKEYPRRGANTTHNVLHWDDSPRARPGGVHWEICQRMEELGLYDRLYYPYRSPSTAAFEGDKLAYMSDQELEQTPAVELVKEDL